MLQPKDADQCILNEHKSSPGTNAPPNAILKPETPNTTACKIVAHTEPAACYYSIPENPKRTKIVLPHTLSLLPLPHSRLFSGSLGQVQPRILFASLCSERFGFGIHVSRGKKFCLDNCAGGPTSIFQ